MQRLFAAGGFTLRKWKTSDKKVEENIPLHFRDQDQTQQFMYTEVFTKVLGVEWNATTDPFRPLVPASHDVSVDRTKRRLLSEVAKLFNVLGWCSPAIIVPKMLIQRLWEENLSWDEVVSLSISEIWERWISTITELQQCLIPRSCFPKEAVAEIQLHGFCNASERADTGVVYIRATDTKGITHISLVVAKTKVVPIKRITIPQLELCGVLVMARLLKHTSGVLSVPTEKTYAWTDSRVVLGWLRGGRSTMVQGFCRKPSLRNYGINSTKLVVACVE